MYRCIYVDGPVVYLLCQCTGGKYLFIGPDYEGDIPEGYFVARSTTYRHWLFMRFFVKDGDLKAATKGLKEGFRSYPLALAENPPKQKIHELSGRQFNTIHANDGHYYEELNAVIQYEQLLSSPVMVFTLP